MSALARTAQGLASGLAGSILTVDKSGGGGGGGGPFLVKAVTFANSRLERGADLSANADGPVGSLSVWLKFAAGGDGVSQRILQSSNGADGLRRNSSNLIDIGWTGATAALQFQTAQLIESTDLWVNVLASWNTNFAPGNKISQLYINDVSDRSVFNDTGIAGSVDYTGTNWTIGSVPGGGSNFNGDMAELWFAETFIDFSIVANRRKFVSATLKPIDLASDGSMPLGTPPALYHSVRAAGAAADFVTNRGSGGAFAALGTALALAGTSPSD